MNKSPQIPHNTAAMTLPQQYHSHRITTPSICHTVHSTVTVRTADDVTLMLHCHQKLTQFCRCIITLPPRKHQNLMHHCHSDYINYTVTSQTARAGDRPETSTLPQNKQLMRMIRTELGHCL